ncbi:MAG TPA: BrnT family toxin [Pyrinomonadaceae bacterium]|nr:BrnT family toxin [Pyrinomonadaceae bacterium]
MRIEWDENKRLINLQKHGIDFADVWQIFDFDTVMDVDERFDYGEIRYLTFGFLRGDVIVVAHTQDDDVFRIISARKAEKYEQEIYFKAIRD